MYESQKGIWLPPLFQAHMWVDTCFLSVFKYAPTADERSGKSDGGAANGQVVNTQFVFRLDYKDWMVILSFLCLGFSNVLILC